MKHAIALLETHMESARTNEPIHRAAGDAKQARLCKQVAWDCLEAIQLLKLEITNRKKAAKAQKGAQS
jgi:hypothetical protein